MLRIASVVSLLFMWSPWRTACAEAAAMPVSLVVRESCEIQSDMGRGAAVAPRVACAHGQPFRVERGDVDPTAGAVSMRPVASTALVSSTASSGRSRPTVWMVTF